MKHIIKFLLLRHWHVFSQKKKKKKLNIFNEILPTINGKHFFYKMNVIVAKKINKYVFDNDLSTTC